MAVYHDRVLPHLVDKLCGTALFDPWRAETARGLRGTVVEIGFGSGLNVGLYPPDVERVLAVEPSDTAFGLAAGRVGRSPAVVERIGLDGRSLPLADASCDSALCTFTLCTVPQPELALAELRRVLVPGGRLHLLEHGLAPDPAVVAWQHRLDPLQGRLGGGCHLTVDPLGLVRAAGFTVEEVTARYAGGPKPWTYFTRLVASAPGGG